MVLLFLLLLLDKAEFIQGTAGSRSEFLSLQSGGTVLREEGPGAAFATFQAGPGKRQVAYYLLLRHRYPGEGKTESSEDVTVEGRSGRARHTLTVNDHVLTVTYSLKLAATLKPAEEKLLLGGKPVDLSRGRVFLVDMTVNPPRWEQRKLDLPIEAPDLSANKAAAAFEEKTTASLLKQDRKVKTFLAGPKEK